ncbi:MAG TPA: M1 family aminopeptidase [bacterium]|nr:M1 family aminopeptidase [bacterium]
MFLAISRFEIKYWLKNWSFYTYLSVFFLMSLLSMAGASGGFGEGSASAENIANSPMSIYGFANFFNKFLLFVIPAIVGNTIYKDYKSNFKGILHTYPFSKTDYLFAKFTSAFLILCLIAFSVLLGLIFGTKLPTVNPIQVLPFDAVPYLHIYFIYLIPNLLLFSIVVFSIVLLSRNIYTGFISIILIWLFKEAAIRLVGVEGLASLLIDPFGESAVQYFTRYWSLSEQNTLSLPLSPIVLINRFVWLLIGAFIFIATFRWFSFSQNPFSFCFKTSKSESLTKNNFGSIIKINLIKQKFDFSFFQQIKTSWKLSQTDFYFIIKNGAFISIVIAGIIFIVAILLQINPQTDIKILPVTWVVLGFPVFFFSFLIQILTFLYAGILVHRAKNSKISDLISVTAVPNWVLLFSKLLALVKMQLLLLSLIMAVGIAIQTYSNYYHYEIGHYLFDLLVIHLISFIIWAFLSLFVQSMFGNVYLSLFLLILFVLGVSQLPSLGIENFAFRFNESPNSDFFLKYSDMSGYGHSLSAYFLYKLYWLVFGLFLFCITLLVWQRELTNSIHERLKIAKKRFAGKLAFISIVLMIIFLFFGFFLFQKENAPKNKMLSVKNEDNLLSQFQKKYGKYKHTKQPRITSVFVKLDIFPETNSFIAKGKYTLINKTEYAIDTLLIKKGFDEITTLSFDQQAALIEEDTIFEFCMYKLDKGVSPNDSINLNFTIKNQKNTLLTQNSNILKNGTYLKSDIFPRLGYFADTEKKIPTNSSSFANHYQSIDADLVNFEAIVSTSPQQIAITSGNLLREWLEDGKRYFHYKMDKPFKFVFGFNSGEFAVLKENYKGVDLRVYYHPKHIYNIQQMMDGLKASLDYNVLHFGTYQYKQVHIIEFSRSEGSYATTAGNCVPISEIRFINDARNLKEDGIDLSFYVAAHELSHQWWGNQVIPANALGATMITESIAEYITAKIYEKKYGIQSALKFLQIQRKRYLLGRANETEQEPPLYLVNPEQSYIAYGKGAIALYTLSEFIGVEKLNTALKEYLDKVKFQPPPYTTSIEMLTYLKKATPDSLQYLITDMFEKNDKEKTLLYFDKILERNNASH